MPSINSKSSKNQKKIIKEEVNNEVQESKNKNNSDRLKYLTEKKNTENYTNFCSQNIIPCHQYFPVYFDLILS